MKIDIKEHGKITIITLHNDKLDALTYESFKRQVMRLINQNKKNIIIDLRNVSFADSRGLAGLIFIYKALVNDGWLGLLKPKKNIEELFKITRMDQIFNIYNSDEEAVAAASSHLSNN